VEGATARRSFGGAEWRQVAERSVVVVVVGVHSSHRSYVWLCPECGKARDWGTKEGAPVLRDLTTTTRTPDTSVAYCLSCRRTARAASLDCLRALARPRAHAATLARCLYLPDVTTPAAYLIFDSYSHTQHSHPPPRTAMSFFGFDAALPRDRGHAANAPGFGQHDAFAGLSSGGAGDDDV
jgi:hypothetical protein